MTPAPDRKEIVALVEEAMAAGARQAAACAHSTEDGHRFHAIVGSHSTPRAVWPTWSWGQARAVGSSGFSVTARFRMLSPARFNRWAL